jgi:hypothetical protein
LALASRDKIRQQGFDKYNKVYIDSMLDWRKSLSQTRVLLWVFATGAHTVPTAM